MNVNMMDGWMDGWTDGQTDDDPLALSSWWG